jgi:hypothetical protein
VTAIFGRARLVLVIVIVTAGCAAAPPSADDELPFTRDGERYKLTRELGSPQKLLWRQEGISWHLVDTVE